MHYELIIGTRNWSSWSLRAWMAVKAAGVPFEEIVLPLRQAGSAALIEAQSPSARVPVLRMGEDKKGGAATAVFDSLAIAETIAERHPDAGLWPEDSTQRAVARSYAAEMHAGFLALREALPMDFARTLPPPSLDREVEGQIARIIAAWQSALSRAGGQGGFLFGRFSIADCMYAPVVSRFVTYDIQLPLDAGKYADRMMKLPAMQEWRAAAENEIANGLPDQWQVEMVRNAR